MDKWGFSLDDTNDDNQSYQFEDSLSMLFPPEGSHASEYAIHVLQILEC